jgi:hypothetical protein
LELGLGLSDLIPTDEQSGLQTHIATENVSLPKKFRPPGQRSFMEGFFEAVTATVRGSRRDARASPSE